MSESLKTLKPAAPAAETSEPLRLVFAFLNAILERGERRRLARRKGAIRELHLELTHRCNLKCVMCHHWQMPFNDPASVRREMNLEQIRALVNGSALLNDVEIVVLTGGEPMLRADFEEIAAFLSRRYPAASLGVLTNFWNTELVRRKLLALKTQGVEKLWLGSSLDGLEATHDAVRGEPGAFAGLIRTAQMVKREFPGVDFSFSFTITPKNYRELWKTYRFVSGLGLWFGAQMVVNHQEREAPETFEWKKGELDAVQEQIGRILGEIAAKGGALERLIRGEERQHLWLWQSLLYWYYLRKYSARPERFFKDCMAGERYAMFDPEGNLFFCPVNKHRTIGNALAQPFDALWRSAKADSEREYVASCRCDCWLNCIANPILDQTLQAGAEK